MPVWASGALLRCSTWCIFSPVATTLDLVLDHGMQWTGPEHSLDLDWGPLSAMPGGKPAPVHSSKYSPDFSSLSICPNAFLISQMGLSAIDRTPRLGYPVCALSHSLSRVSVHTCSLPFPLGPLPGGSILAQCFSSHPTQICLYFSYSIDFIGYLLPVSSFS